MHRRGAVLGATLLALLVVSARAGFADSTLRIQRPLDLVALPLLVMEREHLIERVADAMGLGTITVAWAPPGVGDPLGPLAAGESDLVAVDLVPFIVAAVASAGSPQEVRAVGALAQWPYVLVSRNPKIKTIRDFTAVDHIAVPALKASGPAVMLRMAAAQEWGAEHFAKLDPLVVARPDAAAAAALISGKGDIDAHFSRTPYTDDELANPAIHRVMDSFDIAGPHSAAVLAAQTRLRNASPMLCAAILSALQEADDFIKKNPGAAAEIFNTMVKDKPLPIEELTDMIGDPDLAYTAAPAGVMRLVDFMQRTGELKRHPQSWRELFLPEAKDLPGF